MNCNQTAPKDKVVFYSTKQLYSITFNPDDDIQEKYSKTGDRFKKVVSRIYQTFLPLHAMGVVYVYNIDISEPRKLIQGKGFPRIHAHGSFYFKNKRAILNFLVDWLPMATKNAYIDIDTVSDFDIWYNYCIKYDHITGLDPYSSVDDPWDTMYGYFTKYHSNKESITQRLPEEEQSSSS